MFKKIICAIVFADVFSFFFFFVKHSIETLFTTAVNSEFVVEVVAVVSKIAAIFEAKTEEDACAIEIDVFVKLLVASFPSAYVVFPESERETEMLTSSLMLPPFSIFFAETVCVENEFSSLSSEHAINESATIENAKIAIFLSCFIVKN